MGKSLIDNPLADNDVVINSITGRRFSQEAIEENKQESQEASKPIKEDVKEKLTKDDNKKIKDLVEEFKKEKEDKKAKKQEDKLDEERIEELIQTNKELKEDLREYEEETKTTSKKADTSNNKDYIKKTYLISQEHIDLIEGLALYSGKERKEVVEDLLNKAIALIDPTIIEKAIKEARSKSKKEETKKDIF